MLARSVLELAVGDSHSAPASHVTAGDGMTIESVQPLLTYREAAKILGVSDRTIWSLVDRGELTAVRFGSVRIDPADLRAFIDRSKTSTTIGGGH